MVAVLKQQSGRWRSVGLRLVLSAAAAVAAAWAADRLLPGGGQSVAVWWRAPAVFVAVQLAGRLTMFVLRERESGVFYEDLIRETFFFGLAGLLAAATTILAARHLGGWVGPAGPAAVMYLLVLLGERR